VVIVLCFAIGFRALPLPSVMGWRELVVIMRWRREHLVRRNIGRLRVMIAVGLRRGMRQQGCCRMMVWVIRRMRAVGLEGKPAQLIPSIVGDQIMIVSLVCVRKVDREASIRVR
jgi:hypothetical protein